MKQVTSQTLPKVGKGTVKRMSSENCRKASRDGADVMWRGSSFQTQEVRA